MISIIVTLSPFFQYHFDTYYSEKIRPFQSKQSKVELWHEREIEQISIEIFSRPWRPLPMSNGDRSRWPKPLTFFSETNVCINFTVIYLFEELSPETNANSQRRANDHWYFRKCLVCQESDCQSYIVTMGGA